MCLFGKHDVNLIEDDLQVGDWARKKGHGANEVNGSLCGGPKGIEADAMKREQESCIGLD